MPTHVLMPALSPTMTEGKLAKWLKAEGDAVASGDVLAEIETDKATMEVEAVDEGILGKILIAAGTDGVPVNTPIAVMLADGEDAAAIAAMVTAPVATPAPVPPPGSPSAPASAPPSAPPSAPAVAAAAPGSLPAPGARIFASPLARRIARDAGLDLSRLSGSGPHGRIVRADVDRAIAAAAAAAAAPRPVTPPAAPSTAPAAGAPAGEAPALPPAAMGAFVELPNSSIRKVIAQRLTASKRDIPHYYLSIDGNLDRLLALRAELNSRAEADAFKLSVNDFLIRAIALALKAHPDVNASWTDAAMRLYQTVDIAVAVATPSGLITPVVRNADQKGLAALSNEVRLLAKRAREGKLMPEEYQGGGFTISNLGMFGIREFSAIINPPQAALLAVGAVEKRPIVKDGALAVAEMMSCTLSADHRVIDGANGAAFLATFKRLIEDPILMLL